MSVDYLLEMCIRDRVCCVPIFAVGAVTSLIQEEGLPALPPSFMATLPWLIGAILIVGLILSFSISVRILERKEY